MSIASYKWNFSENEKLSFKICISDSPHILLNHSQEEIELIYFYQTSGCTYFCAGTELNFSSKELAVINSGEIHGCNNWGKDCIIACVIINIKKLNIPSLMKYQYNNKISNNADIINIFNNMKSVLCNQNIKNLELDCTMNSFIYSLLAVLSKESKEVEFKSNRNLEINKILEYIDEKFQEKIKIEELAEIMHLSTDRFYHVFKEFLGISPCEYIIIKRIEKACELLKNSQLKIIEISQKCNFCTSSYFSQKFFKYMKMTPTEYRHQKKLDNLN